MGWGILCTPSVITTKRWMSCWSRKSFLPTTRRSTHYWHVPTPTWMIGIRLCVMFSWPSSMPAMLQLPQAIQPGIAKYSLPQEQALSALGDQKGAMDRFQKALTTPNSNRFDVRLAIAQLMAQQDHSQDAERQIGLGLMEAEAGETVPPTGSQYIAAADVLRQMHEYQLSQTYLERAKAAGASDIAVRVGLANNYLALGDTARASAQLSAVSHVDDSESDYQYLLAEANVYQQEHQGTQALTAFAQAASAAGEDQTAEQGLLQAGANEGYRINSTLSFLSDFSVQPIFEDSTVYVLDSKLDAPTPVPAPTSLCFPRLVPL